MKKTKKILIIIMFLALFILLGTGTTMAAGSLYLNNLDFDIQINENGTMDVVETWDISIEDTNTLFKTFKTDKTKYTSIYNVQVSELTNNNYTSFEEIDELMYHVTKDCYYGLINDNGDFEIAWGVGLEGTSDTKTYQISYTVEDAISKYSDYAELYWQFVGEDFEISSKNITGTITLPSYADSEDEIKVWGHTEGLNGEIYVTDYNQIKFELTNFNSGRYVEIRTLFPTKMITYSARTYETERLKEVIEEETTWANEANARRQRAENNKKVMSVGFSIICILIAIILVKDTIKIHQKSLQQKEIKPTMNIKYYREIPRKNATPAQALFMYRNSSLNFTSKEMGRVFTATMLDLSLKKYLKFEGNADKKNNIIIKILKREPENLENSEKEVLQYILGATSGKDEITLKELEKYMEKHYTLLIKTKDAINSSTKTELKKNEIYDEKGAKEKSKHTTSTTASAVSIIFVFLILLPFLTEYIYGKVLFAGVVILLVLTIIKSIISSQYSKKINIFTQKGTDEQQMWNGLKKFMEEFSLLDKREIPELVIWEEFLVYATVFGIAEKVLKQLKIVYKELQQNLDFDTYGYMYLMMNTDFSSNVSNSMNSAFSSAYSSAYSSGSGSGGGFSGGGGGGRWPEEVEEADNQSAFDTIKNGEKIFLQK